MFKDCRDTGKEERGRNTSLKHVPKTQRPAATLAVPPGKTISNSNHFGHVNSDQFHNTLRRRNRRHLPRMDRRLVARRNSALRSLRLLEGLDGSNCNKQGLCDGPCTAREERVVSETWSFPGRGLSVIRLTSEPIYLCLNAQ